MFQSHEHNNSTNASASSQTSARTKRNNLAKSLLSVAITGALGAALMSPVAVLASPNNTQAEVNPGTVLYKLNPNADASQLKSLNALLNSQGLVKETVLAGSQIKIAKFAQHGRETAIANILKHSGLVQFAEPDYAVTPTLQPNDPNFPNQWHHNNINSQQAWDTTTGDSRVLVAVCDTGFDVNHPDLAGNLRTDLAFNAQDGSNYIFDANGHGTGTAGTLGAVGNNATGVAGVNWNVDIIPVRIAISDTNSSAYISTMATCIEYAADNGARVVNLSYGGIQYSTVDAAAQYLRARNGLLFMSAGNDGQEFATFPDFTSFVGVGATDQNDNRASFSNWGTFVDITAPGVSIRTTYPNNSYVNYSGTSFSSPVAAGVAALMVAANPAITADEIEAGIFATAVDIGASGNDNVFGHGLVDAAAAVNYAVNLGSFVAPTASISTDSTSVPFGSFVALTAANSSDDDGTIVSYQWDLGDGTNSTNVDVIHTYDAAGVYQVNLTVTDNDGLTDSDSVLIEVTNQLPVAVIDSAVNEVAVGETIFLSGLNSYDTDGTITTYQWDFGNSASATGTSVDYSYANAGTYNITLTVTDNAGASNATSITVNVVDPYALTAPSGLTATADGLDVTLNWQDNSSNEAAFVIERGVKYRGKTRFESIATLAADSTTFTETVSATGDYSYQVKAVNSVDEATSETVRVSVTDSGTNPPPPPPGDLTAPSNLSATQNGSAVVLSWADNSDSELGFYIERGEKAKGKINFTRVAVVGAGMTNYTDDVAGLSGSYGYRVQAYNDQGVSGYSATSELRIK